MSINYTPRTWVAGEVVTAAFMNTEVRDPFTGIQAAWSIYTPSWTASTSNPTLGNGTIVGHYLQVGKHIDFWIKLTLGSTTTVGSGLYQITVPIAPFATHPLHFDIFYTDASAGTFYRGVTFLPSGSRVTMAYDNSTAGGALLSLTNTTPVVPAVGDTYEISAATYEAA